MTKNSKALGIPRWGLSQFKYRAKYAYLRLKMDDPESLSFYKELQNSKVKEGEAYPRGEGIGKSQIEFLKRMGIQPSDRLLDIGCGDLRGGRYIIEYLETGNYTGMDISEEAIKRGWITIQEHDLMEKSPSLRVNTDLQFREFWDNTEFDVVFGNSVLTHLSKEYIGECFANLERVLANNGRAYLSFNHDPEGETIISNNISNSNIYRYPFEELRKVGEEHGLRIRQDAYNEHPNNRMEMLLIEIA